MDEEFNSHNFSFLLKLNDLHFLVREHICKQSVESSMSSSRWRTWFTKARLLPSIIAAILGLPLDSLSNLKKQTFCMFRLDKDYKIRLRPYWIILGKIKIEITEHMPLATGSEDFNYTH